MKVMSAGPWGAWFGWPCGAGSGIDGVFVAVLPRVVCAHVMDTSLNSLRVGLGCALAVLVVVLVGVLIAVALRARGDIGHGGRGTEALLRTVPVAAAAAVPLGASCSSWRVLGLIVDGRMCKRSPIITTIVVVRMLFGSRLLQDKSMRVATACFPLHSVATNEDSNLRRSFFA